METNFRPLIERADVQSCKEWDLRIFVEREIPNFSIQEAGIRCLKISIQ